MLSELQVLKNFHRYTAECHQRIGGRIQFHSYSKCQLGMSPITSTTGEMNKTRRRGRTLKKSSRLRRVDDFCIVIGGKTTLICVWNEVKAESRPHQLAHFIDSNSIHTFNRSDRVKYFCISDKIPFINSENWCTLAKKSRLKRSKCRFVIRFIRICRSVRNSSNQVSIMYAKM